MSIRSSRCYLFVTLSCCYLPEYDSCIRIRAQGYQIRGTRGLESGYEDIRSGVRGYLIRGSRASDPGFEDIRLESGYEDIRSGVRWYSRISDLGYEGIRSGVRGY